METPYGFQRCAPRRLRPPRRRRPTAPFLPEHATESGSTWYGPWFDNQKLFPPFEPLFIRTWRDHVLLYHQTCCWATRPPREPAMGVGSRSSAPEAAGSIPGMGSGHWAAPQSRSASCSRAPRRWTEPTISAVTNGLLWTGLLWASGVPW